MSIESITGFRLSPQQERLVATAHEAGYPPSVCLYICAVPVDEASLRLALANVVARHEILRTVFRKQRELKLPMQVILDSDVPAVQVENLSHLNADEQQTELRFRVSEAARSVRAADEAPVVSATLFLLGGAAGAENAALLVEVAGPCCDTQAFAVLAEELRKELAGEPPDDNLIQYADVTEWQHDLLNGTEDAANAAKVFWQAQTHTPISLPFEGAGERGPAESVRLAVEPELSSRLRSVAGIQGATEADVLLAVWQVLLGRMSGEGRITTLVACDGREYDELKNAIGLFVRYLPIAIDLEGKTRFEEVLRQVATVTRQARAQQDWFAPGSATEQAAIGFEYNDLRSAHTGIVPVALHVAPEKLKLRLIATAVQAGLDIQVEYDPGRYTRESMEGLADSLRALLWQVLADSQVALANLSLLSTRGQQSVLEMGLGPVVDRTATSVHGLLSAQGFRTAGSIGVRSGSVCLTYGDLELWSNRLGRYLGRLGVARGSLVGLCVGRSAQMMVPVLGILKAGGAYVPLSADQPKSRTAQQLEGLKVLVTEAEFVSQLPDFAGTVVVLDGAEKPWEEESGVAPEVEIGSDDLAYVIYTSGSTGTPKGVAVTHGNLVNYATHIVRALKLDEQPLQYATVSTLTADLGNTVIYPALLTGGCLHVLPYEVATDARRMAEYQEQYRIDVLKIVPSHLAALMEGAGQAVLPNRFLITGGEALKPALVEKIGDACAVVNHYGPTETTVGSLMLPLSEWNKTSTATVPIGRPIANTRVYVLDANRQLVPVGVAGELYIAGAGVTAGYIGQPAMTTERFVADPFADPLEPHATMYRTGDLVRWLPEGVVEFLGRADDQVKIRGFRVELGEIETVLASQPGVRQSVVVARARTEGELQVVAYVVLDRQQAATTDTLKAALQERLPDYMVPSAIVELTKLPLTTNGKVDRKALPAPEERAARQYKAPATATEELVAQIWSEVLKVQNISTDENFFELGGHSLLATQVISRIRRLLEVDVPLRTMFDTPTVGRIAERIDTARLEDNATPAMVRVQRDGPLPLSFAQQRLWILDQLEPNNPLYNIPRILRMKGRLNVQALHRSLNAIIARHEPLRTWFGTAAGEPVQHIEGACELHLHEIDLSAVPETEREAQAHEIVAEEARTPFDLSVAPLLRGLLLKLSADDHVLMLTMHHIVSDGWSATVFRQELRAFYEAFADGKEADLPELTLQYADYASWQRNWLQGETLNRQLAFWRDQLAEAPAVLTLPTDRPRPEKQTFAGGEVKFTLAPETYAALKELCRQDGVTLFMALLAGYQALLSRLSGQEQVVVGTDSANRFTVETERMIGFFINLLPLKADFSGDPTFREGLRRSRATTLACYAHQEMPFDKIVEELRPDRTLSHNPILQTLFVMQNAPVASRQLGDLEISGFGVPITRSKFDIAVFAIERNATVDFIWVYSTELFDGASVESMAQSFGTLLASAVSDPEARIGGLELLSEDQKQRLREERLERKNSSKSKLRNTGLKTVGLGIGAAE